MRLQEAKMGVKSVDVSDINVNLGDDNDTTGTDTNDTIVPRSATVGAQALSSSGTSSGSYGDDADSHDEPTTKKRKTRRNTGTKKPNGAKALSPGAPRASDYDRSRLPGTAA